MSGISDEIFTLVNNVQIRPSTNVVISKTDAKYYIDSSYSNLEILPTKYYEVFPNSSKYTGYVSNSNIGDFFNDLNSITAEPCGILGGITESKIDNLNKYAPSNPLDYSNMKSNQAAIFGERGAENIGLAVFKNDKLVGELNAIETTCYSIITNQISNFFITIEDPDNENNYIDLYLYLNHSPKNKVEIINGTPYITVSCNLEGRIYSIKSDANYLDSKSLDKISKCAAEYMNKQLYNYLYKTAKKYKSDINGFGVYARKNFNTVKDFEKYNWPENYSNSFFKVKCDVCIKSGYQITET